MTSKSVEDSLRAIIFNHFNISPDQFSWDKPLSALCEDFNILSYLLHLEQLLNAHYREEIPLLENISSDFHSLDDVLKLIKSEI